MIIGIFERPVEKVAAGLEPPAGVQTAFSCRPVLKPLINLSVEPLFIVCATQSIRLFSFPKKIWSIVGKPGSALVFLVFLLYRLWMGYFDTFSSHYPWFDGASTITGGLY